VAGLFSRVVDAARFRVAATAERFVQAAEDARRSANREPQSYAQARAEIEEAAKRRPPSEEYDDLPISVWSNWSIASIRNTVEQFVVGTFGQAAILAESMIADDRIQAAVNGRTKGVTKCDWNFEPAKGGKRQARQLEELWPEIVTPELTEQILFWTIFMGFCLCEIIWEPKDDLWIPRLKIWHPLYIYYRVDIRKYVAITATGQVEIEEGDPKWFLFAPWGSYRGWLRGAVRSCSIPWVVRQFALRDFARFSEVHGLPIKKLMVPSQAPAPDKARFFASVQRLGSESMFSLPQQGDGKGGVGPSFDVQLLEAKDRAWEAFPGLIGQCERSITLAIRGTNLTTELDGGSFAAAETHRDEDSDYAQADRRKLAAALKTQVARPFCLYNYGNADLAPALSLNAPEPGQEAQAKVISTVLPALLQAEEKGWPVSRKGTADRFGIELREDMPADKPVEELEAEKKAKEAQQMKLFGGKDDDAGGPDDVDREDPDLAQAAE
jgi:phage gp29-like protein